MVYQVQSPTYSQLSKTQLANIPVLQKQKMDIQQAQYQAKVQAEQKKYEESQKEYVDKMTKVMTPSGGFDPSSKASWRQYVVSMNQGFKEEFGRDPTDAERKEMLNIAKGTFGDVMLTSKPTGWKVAKEYIPINTSEGNAGFIDTAGKFHPSEDFKKMSSKAQDEANVAAKQIEDERAKVSGYQFTQEGVTIPVSKGFGELYMQRQAEEEAIRAGEIKTGEEAYAGMGWFEKGLRYTQTALVSQRSTEMTQAIAERIPSFPTPKLVSIPGITFEKPYVEALIAKRTEPREYIQKAPSQILKEQVISEISFEPTPGWKPPSWAPPTTSEWQWSELKGAWKGGERGTGSVWVQTLPAAAAGAVAGPILGKVLSGISPASWR